MHNVQKIVMMRYGYRDENARAETWNPYDDAQLVSVDAEVLKARLGDWNRAIVDRRVKELKKANVEAEKSIASTIDCAGICCRKAHIRGQNRSSYQRRGFRRTKRSIPQRNRTKRDTDPEADELVTE